MYISLKLVSLLLDRSKISTMGDRDKPTLLLKCGGKDFLKWFSFTKETYLL